MNEQNQLIYPTIDLFLYDLQEGLGQNEKGIDLKRQHFWERIYGSNLDSQRLEKLKQAEKYTENYVELLDFKKVEEFEYPWNGFYYPLQLGDTYALQVDCSGKKYSDLKFSPQPISCLQKIKEQILFHINHKHGQIGQSWLIWGKLSAEDQDTEKTAQECYEKHLQLVSNANWKKDLKGQGKLLGANIYELWRLPSNSQQMSENFHILIWLLPSNQNIESDEFKRSIKEHIYPNLIRLFCYRNKVIWNYVQSRQIKTELKRNSQEVQKIVDQLPEQFNAWRINVQQLQKSLANTLTLISKYGKNLTYIDDYYRNIKTNINNFEKRWQQLKNLDNKSEIEFLKEFIDFASEKYLLQVETDYANLSPGLTLLENSIKTIEGIIAIEQTKSENRLSDTVTAVGIGLAVSEVSSNVIVTQQPPPKNTLFFLTPAFNLSVATFAIASLIALIFVRLFRR